MPSAGSRLGRRRDHLDADAVALLALHDGVGRDLAAGSASHQGRQLADEVDPLLGQDRDPCRRLGEAPVGRVGSSSTTQTPLPSYPPRAVLRTTGKPPTDVRERRDLSGSVATTACRGAGTPSSSSRARITALSWACTRAAGPGRVATPSAASASRCPVGTCSWSNVTTAHGLAQCRSVVEVGVVADLDVGDDLGRRSVGGLGEQPQRHAEPDRRLLHHPGQLTRAHDSDHRGFHGGRGYPS